MNLEKYLEEVQSIDSKIVNKLYEIEMWKDIARGSTASSDGERVQSSSSQQKMANAVAKYTDLEKEIERLEEMKIRFIERIEKLPRNYYVFMHDMYIKGMTVTEVARNNGKSDSWGSNTHSRAKAKLLKVIGGEYDEV